MCVWSLKVASAATHITVSNNALTRVSPMSIPTYNSIIFLQRQNGNTYEKSKRLMKNINTTFLVKSQAWSPAFIYQKQLLLFALLS